MLSPALVIATAFAYLGALFAIAAWGDRRAAEGRSVVANPWTYALSIAVYCTAWTYFGSVGRAAASGVWFLPIYLGPTLAMVLAWMVVRKMIRIARRQRITSIADFVASRYGKSPALAGLVTLITVVGIVPYIALQLKAIAVGYAVLTAGPGAAVATDWWRDTALYVALLLAGFTMVFGTRHLDSTERHEGLVAAIAFESVVKLLAFLAVGVFVTWGMFGGVADLFGRAAAVPELAVLLRPVGGAGAGGFAWGQWFALTVVSMLSVIFLPRQFQVMVVENVDERHLKRAAWVFPLYLLLINLFVLPIALAGQLHFGIGHADADAFVLSLPLSNGALALALAAFIGGLSAATGMVIVEAIAVSTMVCNDLVMPALLRLRRLREQGGTDLTALLLAVRRAAILLVLLLGWLYYRLAGEAYALVSIGLISFAAVAQFAPALLGGMYWKGATRSGALAGLLAGFGLWVYTLLLPSFAKSGWLAADFMQHGPWGVVLLRPEALLGVAGLDPLTHALFFSLLANVGAFVGVSLWREPPARELSQAALFVEVFEHDLAAQGAGAPGAAGLRAVPAFWRGRAAVSDLQPLVARFLGAERARHIFEDYAARTGAASIADIRADAQLVQHVETQLAGAIGSASARVMVASVVQEETLSIDDVLQMLEEASELRRWSRALEEKSASLQQATEQLKAANARLRDLDRLKDDFVSSVTHELRTPLTSIRALAEMMADDPEMAAEQRARFLDIIVAESERLSRLVNQVLDLAKLESGQAEWRGTEVDIVSLVQRAARTMAQPLADSGTQLELDLPSEVCTLRADPDRLTQVLLNLLSNAAKHVPRAGGRIRVRVRAEAAGLRVRVMDNGPGVPVALHEAIFEKFHQVAEDGRAAGGTGLGLTISRRIVEHYGGRLRLVADPGTADSDLGQGACFEFTIPWHPAGATPPEPPHGDESWPLAS